MWVIGFLSGGREHPAAAELATFLSLAATAPHPLFSGHLLSASLSNPQGQAAEGTFSCIPPALAQNCGTFRKAGQALDCELCR
ncbi:hypothetical protein GCM10017783_06690 [Deinococcus piscis]|uniref:Uncharacterized protein n=1 Tax=Deinococcus piscis TaxID=394230 RepID=A0ABQ3JZL8_9DEIO|nr:hypothetical protein GCM10017783_06690 [Deinococcus piscis]